MKNNKYLTILFVVCISSYFMLYNICNTEGIVRAEIVKTQQIQEPKKDLGMKSDTVKDPEEEKLVQYTCELTGLGEDVCRYLVTESSVRNVDPFVVLGVIKRESDFNPDAVGLSGERGLGQLMENTAVPLTKNLGHKYDPDRLFEPKYNIELTITQLSYLNRIYDGDIHKTLTAYNRGQQGLIDYIELKKSTYIQPSMSDYSMNVLKFSKEYKKGFEESGKIKENLDGSQKIKEEFENLEK